MDSNSQSPQEIVLSVLRHPLRVLVEYLAERDHPVSRSERLVEVGDTVVRLVMVGVIFGLVGLVSALVFNVREEVAAVAVGVATGIVVIGLEVDQRRDF